MPKVDVYNHCLKCGAKKYPCKEKLCSKCRIEKKHKDKYQKKLIEK